MTMILLSLLGPKGLVFATIDPSSYSATLSLQNQSAMEITPTDWSQDIYVSTMRTVNVTSTGLSEYKIFANIPSSDSANGSLVMVGGTSSSPTVSQVNARPSTATTLSTDTWGFGIPSGTSGLPTNSFSNQYTAGTPSTSSTYSGYDKAPAYTLLRDVTNATGNDSFNLYYSVRAGADVLTNPGTYQTNVDYHIVGNASNVSGGEATISPASGPKAGGTTVTITTSMMTDFVPPNISVSIGGQTCTSPSASISSGVLVITCTAPAHYPGATNVVVDVASLDMTYTIPNGYTYIETGDVRITNVAYVSGINVSGTPQPTVDSSNNIDFDLTFNGGQDNNDTLQATYRVTIANSTSSDYTFTAPESNLTLRISQNEVRDISYSLSGISVGDTIPANTSVSFNIILSADYVSGQHSAEGGVGVDPVNQDVGNLVGYFTNGTTGDLSGNNTLTPFQITVENTFDEAKSFMIQSLNSGFEIVNSSGNALGSQTIAANTTGSYTFYMKKSSTASFASETATADIILSYDSMYTNVGEVQITVDRDPAFVDTEAPTIRDVTITRDNTVDGKATLTWAGSDNVGVASYGIYVCTTTCGNMISVGNTVNSYTFSNLQDTTYHFVVVGFDDEGNTATQAQINGANTNPGPASSTGDKPLSWSYTVTWDITNGSMTNTTGNTVRAGGTWEGTITPSGNNNRPSSKSAIAVVMNGETYNDFDYNSNTGRVTITGATGNITISAQLTCLIEGTMIAVLDENGQATTKPIEDITYNDLLIVWNHETGSIGYVHPARIEKESSTTEYQLTRFSDGTELGTFGWHGIFSVDANQFVSVSDPDAFYPGVKVQKVEDGELVTVTVESIETVQEETKLYHILSSRYYNIIANGLLTTDGNVITSNFYGFTEHNIMWPETRNEFMSNPDNLYTYEDFADLGIPLRMFIDLRLEEASYLQNYGITLRMFKDYLLVNGVVSGMVPYDDS